MITLYHGSTQIIDEPSADKGKKNNDYGRGFYCTESSNLASEWACKTGDCDGFVNQYTLDVASLKVLDLSKPEYNILHWLTLLVQNRTFVLNNQISIQGAEFLKQNFTIDISEYDIIKGYRADDSYFSFAEDFLNNTITTEQLARAMKLGKLGIQHVLISQKAFENLFFVRSTQVDSKEFHLAHKTRDQQARDNYFQSKQNDTISRDAIYLVDLIRGGSQNGDKIL